MEYSKEEEWIVLNSKSSIVVERHGDKVAIFTNDQLKRVILALL
jgi:hypothetical protein